MDFLVLHEHLLLRHLGVQANGVRASGQSLHEHRWKRAKLAHRARQPSAPAPNTMLIKKVKDSPETRAARARFFAFVPTHKSTMEAQQLDYENRSLAESLNEDRRMGPCADSAWNQQMRRSSKKLAVHRAWQPS